MVKAQNNSNRDTRVNVKPTVQNSTIGASSNLAKYYADLSKAYATSEGLVLGEDYSSKTYALQAKEYANDAKEAQAVTEEYSNNAVSNIKTLETNALNNIVIQEESALENINTSVTSGVEAIETLQDNSIAEITTNKETALANITTASSLGLSNITTAETNALANIDTDLNNATNEINTNRTNTLAQISTLANTSISDINTTAKSYDNLTYRNITNCLLEVPQRIKYTLENGTLTVKAGTVVIFAYGTEDKTAQYPVGSTFINDNFKVYDTQFADGKFFVWAELVNDVVNSDTIADTLFRVFGLRVTTTRTVIQWNAYGESGSGYTGTSNCFYYNTSSNLGEYYATGVLLEGSTLSLPLGRCVSDGTYAFGSITQIFNGIGYIGSTIWVDKGVKGLIPNKRNEDGSLNNNEFAFSMLILKNCTHTGTHHLRLGNNSILIGDMVYDEINNQNTVNGQYRGYAIAGGVTASSGAISDFNPKQPIRLVDYNEFEEIDFSSLVSVPDYSTGVSVANGYVTQYPCYIYAKATIGDWGTFTLYADGVAIYSSVNHDSGSRPEYVVGFVGAGVTITNSKSVAMTIYKLKGVTL